MVASAECQASIEKMLTMVGHNALATTKQLALPLLPPLGSHTEQKKQAYRQIGKAPKRWRVK